MSSGFRKPGTWFSSSGLPSVRSRAVFPRGRLRGLCEVGLGSGLHNLMEGYASTVALHRKRRVFAAGKQGVGASESTQKLTDDMRHIISNLGGQFSRVDLSASRGTTDIEERLDALKEKLLRWESERPMTWDTESIEVSEYLQAVDEVKRFIENLEAPQLGNVGLQGNEILCHARSILQMAMVRLEEEFVHLVQHRQPLELDHTSFWSMEEDVVEDYSNNSFNDESMEFKP